MTQPPPSLLALPSYAMGRVSARGRRRVVAALEGEGLLLRHYAVLAGLEEYGPCPQRVLADRMGYDPADLVGLLAAVQERGLVSRDRDPHDRRRYVVALTEQGRCTLGRCHALAAAAQEELLAPLSERDRQALCRLLRKLV